MIRNVEQYSALIKGLNQNSLPDPELEWNKLGEGNMPGDRLPYTVDVQTIGGEESAAGEIVTGFFKDGIPEIVEKVRTVIRNEIVKTRIVGKKELDKNNLPINR